MPDAAPAIVDPITQARAEIAAYEAANHPPEKPTAPAANGKADVKPDAAVTAKTEPVQPAVSTEKAADKDNAPVAPESDGAVDLSFLPEDVRPEITVKSKAAANKLKSGWMGHAKVTQGFQEIAAIKRDAENWRAAVSDPVKAKAITKILVGEAPEAEAEVEDEVEIDPLTMDGKSLKEAIRKEAAKLIEAERRKAAEEASAPTRHMHTINAAISAFVESKGIDPDTMKAAVTLWKQDLAENGGSFVDVPPGAVPALLAPYLRLTRVTPAKAQTNAETASARSGGLSEVASPNGRVGSSAGSTVVVPDHVRAGRPASTAEEFNAELEYAFKKRLGADAELK